MANIAAKPNFHAENNDVNTIYVCTDACVWYEQNKDI